MNLTITTPYMRGDDVRKIQTPLKIKGYLQGDVDGVYGPDTARAVYRAKYWLGYPIGEVDQVAGDLFFAYITGDKDPTKAMLARTKDRQLAAAGKPIRQKMIEEADNWIGTKENPFGSNECKFSKWYGLTGPWCAMFVTWCGITVGSKAFIRGMNYAYVPYIVSNARAGRNWLAVTYEPKYGDLVTFDWDNDKLADHIGFFDHWLYGAKMKFRTIEGNTSVGNDSNGGEVMERERDKSDVLAFIHVGQ
jgi:CHAP domain/Putative peptidoglycan binding domain